MGRSRTALMASKWVGLAAAMWVQASAGNAYTFSFYSPMLKSVLHYNQLQLNNLGVAKDIGENVGLLTGFLCNKIPAWTILCIGALCGFLGYGTLWLVVSGQIAPLPYWMMCALLCIGGNSTTWFNTAVLVTCMRNFPHSRGTVVGILKGFIGLSAAIFAQVFTSVLGNDPVALLLFLALGPTAVCLASMFFIQPVPAAGNIRDPDERSNFHFITAVCLALAAYLLAITFVEDFTKLNPYVPTIFTAVVVIFLIAPLAVPLKALSLECYGHGPEEENTVGVREPFLKEPDNSNGQNSTPPLITEAEEEHDGNESVADSEVADSEVAPSPQPDLSDQEEKGKFVTIQDIVTRINHEDEETLLVVGEGAVKRPKRRKPRRGEDFNLRQALVKADFWLLFLTFFCGVGTGVTAINNLGQIGEAQGYYNVNIFVTLISIANFLGRLGGGALSEHYIRTNAIPRTIWMGAAQVCMIFAHLLFASARPGSLYAGSVLLGLCYGVHFSIVVPTASELFGLKHFGMIYNFLTMANPLGSLLFSGLIAGYIYDREAAKDSAHLLFISWPSLLEKAQVCTGAHCFRLTFYIMACVCTFGVLLTTLLTCRIRVVYVSLYAKSPRPSTSDLKSLEQRVSE